MNDVVQRVKDSCLFRFMTTYVNPYYEEIVKKFYAKAKVRPDAENLEYIICILGEKEFKIASNDLKETFSLPNEGEIDFNDYGKKYEKKMWRLMSISKKDEEMTIYCKEMKLMKEFICIHDIFSKALECKIGSHDQLTNLQQKMMTTVIKDKKVNWTLFIFNRLVEKITKESVRKGYRLVLNTLMNCIGINMGNDRKNITNSKWLGATELA